MSAFIETSRAADCLSGCFEVNRFLAQFSAQSRYLSNAAELNRGCNTVNPTQRKRFVTEVKDASLRKVAEEHPDCLHPCVWLVKDKNEPLRAGGKPRLPVGREWPRADGKLLNFVMSIDTALLPEWSPLPPNAGELLIFVSHMVC